MNTRLTFRIEFAGLKILTRLIICYILNFSVSAYAETQHIVKLHSPSIYEIKELKEIFRQEKVLYGDFHTGRDHSFGWNDVEVSEIHLDNDKNPELVVRVNNPGFDGSAGYGFDIWKKIGTKWQGIAGDDFKEKHAIIVTDRMVNGFRVFRVPSDPYDRVYNGQSYMCPDCPL